MAENEQNKVKIRLKLRSGEEFEAEGSPDFIEKQRAEFLQLIGKPAKNQEIEWADLSAAKPVRRSAPRLPSVRTFAQNTPTDLPAAPVYPAPNITQSGFAAAEQASLRGENTLSSPTQSPKSTHTALWEQVVKVDDGLVILRRKSRLLSPETAAIVLIAAAKELLHEKDGYSALALSKSLTKSGYGGGRLDRVLTSEMRQGTVKAVGSKRSRAYVLSDEGFARGFVLAEKLAGEWH